MADLRDCKPQLGCATTRELLEEVVARADTDQDRDAGSAVVAVVLSLLDTVPERMLAYRTVDSG